MINADIRVEAQPDLSFVYAIHHALREDAAAFAAANMLELPGHQTAMAMAVR